MPSHRRTDDIEIAQTDQGELNGYIFDKVTVVATLSDIGDPRFRLWLGGALKCRMREHGTITIEVV